MSQYPFEEQPRRRGGNVWFYIILVIVAAVVGGLFVRYMWPALQKPGAEPQATMSPTPAPQGSLVEDTTVVTTPVVPVTEEATTQETQAAQAPAEGDLIKGGATVNENADLPDVLEVVGKAVVGISNRAHIAGRSFYGTINGIPVPSTEDTEEEQGFGSGVIISTDGYIISNAHVVDDASTLVVILAGGEEVEAKLIGSDESSDIALLKIEKEGLTAVAIGDSDAVRIGETALAIGNPMGQELYGTVTKGIISATRRQITVGEKVYTVLQTDAAINPGNSGGALINAEGKLIGVCSAKTVSAGMDESGNIVSAEGLGFAVPINDAMKVAQELKEHGFVARPVLGVSGGFLTEQGAMYYRCPVGFLVQSLAKNGGAEQAGVRAMDIITAIDGTELTSYKEMSALISAKEVGDRVKLTVWRDNTTLDIEVTLGSSGDTVYEEEEPVQQEDDFSGWNYQNPFGGFNPFG